MQEAEAAFAQKPAASGGVRRQPPRSLEMGLAESPGANFALISMPGDYAAAEAMKALQLGLQRHAVQRQRADRRRGRAEAHARARATCIVMGPDCGTAIIDGVPLGFANVVRRGDIGVVAASGTGLQQVTCLVDRLGEGISQAIGTGGHDLSREVGGITMLQGLAALAADAATRVIVLISKPPAPDIADRVLERARAARKPVVVIFLGADPKTIAGANLTPAKTLEDAAHAAVALCCAAKGREPAPQRTERRASKAPPRPEICARPL